MNIDFMHIVCCTDSGYIMPTGVMLCSLCRNNADIPLHIHAIVDSSVTAEHKQQLASVLNPHDQISFYDAGQIKCDFPKIGVTNQHVTAASYYRLFLSQLLPEDVDKVIYLDGDIIVRGSVRDMWNADVSDVALAAVKDMDERVNLQRIDYPVEYGYFNAGVLLVNLIYWRKHQLVDVFNSFMKSHADKIVYHDQDDIWMPNHLEVLLNAIGDKMMACGNCLLIDGDGVNRGITYWQEELFNGIPKGNLELAYSIVFFRNPFQGASMMINVKYINYILPIPQNLGYHDSWVSILACFCGGLSYVDVVITKYRMHGGNVTKVRLKPKSRWKEFLRSAKNPCFYDREAMLDGIENRLSLSSKDEKELNRIKSLVKRGKTFWGRIGIIPFKLKYYKTIYY